MKIILDNFNYRGKHFSHYECDLPQLHDVDETNEERLTEYIKESLDELMKEES